MTRVDEIAEVTRAVMDHFENLTETMDANMRVQVLEWLQDEIAVRISDEEE